MAIFKKPTITRMDNTRDYVQENYLRMGEVKLKLVDKGDRISELYKKMKPISIPKVDNTRDYVQENYLKMGEVKLKLVDNKTDRLLKLYNGQR